MTVSTGMSAAALAQSSAAVAAAQEAKRTACEGFMPTFDAKTASVEAMRRYADCVDLLYAEPLTDAQTLVLKLVLVACFIGGGVGAWVGWDDGFNGVVGPILGFLVGFVMTGVGLLIIGLLFAAGAWVIGG